MPYFVPCHDIWLSSRRHLLMVVVVVPGVISRCHGCNTRAAGGPASCLTLD
jgi:hypothetical protein